MRHLAPSVDYSRHDAFNNEIEKYTLEDAKQKLRELHEEYRNLHKVAYRSSVCIDQYKKVLKIVEDFQFLEKKGKSDNGISLQDSMMHLCAAWGEICYYLVLVTDSLDKCDMDTKVISVANKFFRAAYNLSKFSKLAEYLPVEKEFERDNGGARVKNLWRSEKRRRKKKSQSFRESEPEVEEFLTDSLPYDQSQHHDKPSKSFKGRESKSVKKQEKCERPSKNEEESRKPFSVKFHNSINLFSREDFENGKMNERSFKHGLKQRSSSFDKSASSSIVNERDLSPEINETHINHDKNYAHQKTGVGSKRTRRYKRKHSLNSNENNVNEDNYDVAQSLVSVSKKPRRFRKNNCSDAVENDVSTKHTGDSKTHSLQSFTGASKRLERSIKYHASNDIESGLSENEEQRNFKKLKRADSPVNSEAEAETVVAGKRRRKRGRRRKINQNVNENIRSSDDENGSHVHFPQYWSTAENAIKYACVHLDDVLNDPDAQHYPDVMKCRKEKEKENVDLCCREKKETDETVFTKDRNETEALQEWNVVDAVSDEEDKEYNSEEIGEQSNNESDNDRQESDFDSDFESEQIINNKVLENDDSNREENEYYSSGELFDDVDPKQNEDKYCPTERDSSDSEKREYKRGPSTPKDPCPESDINANSDDNDGDAESATSFEEEDSSQRNLASDPRLDGKTGPRTPPTPPRSPLPSPLVNSRRGPKTPPGNGPDSEVTDEEDSSSD